MIAVLHRITVSTKAEWHPVRIVRNKPRAFNNGHWYTIEDYYLPLQLGLRLIDLQRDRQ